MIEKFVLKLEEKLACPNTFRIECKGFVNLMMSLKTPWNKVSQQTLLQHLVEDTGS